VTLGGKPVPRVAVLLVPTGIFVGGGMQSAPPLKATTDDDGRYRLIGVEAGNYRISPHAPALVPDAGSEVNQTVTIADGEEAEDVDFSLRRGGVITGRVMDAEGRPVIGQRIDLIPVDDRGRRINSYNVNVSMQGSDDRGVYRIYGLAPGHYKLSVGDAPESGMIRIGFAGANYARTFYPDVSEEARARIIELAGAAEVTGVDITMGRPSKTYAASGRIIDAETGVPVPDVRYGYGGLSPGQRSLGAFGVTNNRSNSNGEFKIEGLAPGRYATFALPEGQLEFYSEPAIFDISGTDVSQIEIKVRRGSSISGVAVLEGTDDPEALAKLSKLDVRAFVESQEMSAPTMGLARVGLDGGFRLGGLRPGKVRIQLGNFPPIKGISLLRVELEGVEQRDGIEIGPGENLTGVRLVIGHGTGIVRGQVKIEGGDKPPNARLLVTARRQNSHISLGGGSAQVDARGRFSLEGLVPGEYEVVVRLMVPPPPPPPNAPPGVPPPPSTARPVSASQNVVVTNGAEAAVTIVLNLGAKEKDNDK
jgi:protocatechuate 3,4-dioxygenase beta subunit